MDMYRATNLDVPLLLLCVRHQAMAGVSQANYLETISGLQRELVSSFNEAEETLQGWLRAQAAAQAEETLQKLQRLGLLDGQAEPSVVREHLARDNRRLSQRISSEALMHTPETGLLLFQPALEVEQTSPLLQSLQLSGPLRRQGEDVQSEVPQAAESWFLFRGSLHLDLLDRFLRERVQDQITANTYKLYPLERISISISQLLYQVGADLGEPDAGSEVIFSFDERLTQYQEIRAQLAGLLEELAEGFPLLHGSFWQQRGLPGQENLWMLRFLLAPPGESASEVFLFQDLVNALERLAGPEVRAALVGGRLFIGKRILM